MDARQYSEGIIRAAQNLEDSRRAVNAMKFNYLTEKARMSFESAQQDKNRAVTMRQQDILNNYYTGTLDQQTRQWNEGLGGTLEEQITMADVIGKKAFGKSLDELIPGIRKQSAARAGETLREYMRIAENKIAQDAASARQGSAQKQERTNKVMDESLAAAKSLEEQKSNEILMLHESLKGSRKTVAVNEYGQTFEEWSEKKNKKTGKKFEAAGVKMVDTPDTENIKLNIANKQRELQYITGTRLGSAAGVVKESTGAVGLESSEDLINVYDPEVSQKGDIIDKMLTPPMSIGANKLPPYGMEKIDEYDPGWFDQITGPRVPRQPVEPDSVDIANQYYIKR